MTHDEVVAAIQARARARGILSHYCGQAQRCQGDRGAPDLLIVGRHAVAWIEVKTRGDQLSPEQIRWRYALAATGATYEVMYEHDLAPGAAVDLLLDFVST